MDAVTLLFGVTLLDFVVFFCGCVDLRGFELDCVDLR